MDTAAPFAYTLLGSPALTRKATQADEEEELRFKHRPSWRLVAYLYECGGREASDHVCRELLLNESTVSQIVSDCNRILGEGAVKRKAGQFTLNLRQIETDAARFHACVRQAENEPTAACRISLLRAALDLVRGDFLAGFAESPRDWVTAHQKRWRNRTAKVGQMLIDLYEEQNQPREAYEAVQKLALLLPQNEQFSTLLLRYDTLFGELHSPDSGSLAEWIAFTRQLTKRGLTATLREAKQFHVFFAPRWKQIGEAERCVLERLCLLEGRFDAELAAAVCEVTREELIEFAHRALLVENAGCFEMPLPMRDWIRGKIPSNRKTALQIAHHRGVIGVFRSGLQFDWHITPEQCDYWKSNIHHLDAAIKFIVNVPVLPPELPLDLVHIPCLRGAVVLLPERASDVYAFFARCMAQNDTSPMGKSWLNHLCGLLAASRRDFPIAIQHFHRCLELLPPDNEPSLEYHAVLSCLQSLHHGGRLSEAISLAEAWIEKAREHNTREILYDLLKHYAESLLASGRYEEAYHFISEAISLAFSFSPPVPIAPSLYHQGMTLAGLERDAEALASFDEALALFEQSSEHHGIADCLQQLGKIHARRGQINTGKRMIEEALELYARVPQMQSRAACLRSLGDVLKLKGDLEGATATYREGLAFWENEVAEGRGGENWVQRFRERLEE